MEPEPIISVARVSKTYPSGFEALKDVDLTIHRGEIFALLGPNGAGKTTTMRVMTGYLKATTGTVTVDGIDIAVDPVGARARIGYMPESSAVPKEMTVANFLSYCARLRRVPRSERNAAVAKAVRQAGLGTVTSDRIGTLSKGFRQRVALAQALVHDPEVLILDEPTAGLDPRQVVETRELIAKLGRKRSVLLSSHLLSEVANLDTQQSGALWDDAGYVLGSAKPALAIRNALHLQMPKGCIGATISPTCVVRMATPEQLAVGVGDPDTAEGLRRCARKSRRAL
jgi:ABC-2 type transport system ATP-binding protein